MAGAAPAAAGAGNPRRRHKPFPQWEPPDPPPDPLREGGRRPGGGGGKPRGPRKPPSPRGPPADPAADLTAEERKLDPRRHARGGGQPRGAVARVDPEQAGQIQPAEDAERRRQRDAN